jgi:uncharacterized protein
LGSYGNLRRFPMPIAGPAEPGVARSARRKIRAVNLVLADDTPRQSWRNGGGRTRELLAGPDPSAWRFRVSVAEIDADGPFSVFAGVQRWFAVIAGAGVELTIDGRQERVTPQSDPLPFAGAALTSCRLLDGPTLDLNLMLRNATGRMVGAVDDRAWQPTAPQCGFFSAGAGHCSVDGTLCELPAHALLWFEHAPARLSFATTSGSRPSCGWWLEVDLEAGRR